MSAAAPKPTESSSLVPSCRDTAAHALAIVRDLHTGTEEHYSFGDNVYGSETAMAPRVGSTAEDDGYLVTLTTDMNQDASFAVVFDAARVSDGPVCKLKLPERISSGTHSTWAPGAELRRWQTADSAASAVGL